MGVHRAHSGECPHGFGQVPKGALSLSPPFTQPFLLYPAAHTLPWVIGQVISQLQIPHPLSCGRCPSVHWRLLTWWPVGLFPVPGQPSDPAIVGVTPRNFQTISPSQRIVFLWAIQAEILLGGIMCVMVEDSDYLLFPQEGTPPRPLGKPPQNVLLVLGLEYGEQLSSM